ncbi:MAG TPA: hypothetical protein VEO54_13605 [Thermoanaerobaculia bacterium]|nr:hypothetical protein [Thermoanaerobaculia bacterium]
MLIVVALLALAACRGEPVPRDYQNAPPDVSNPPQTKSDTPSQGATGTAPPQPSTGNEGKAGPYEQMTTEGGTTTTMPDTPPTST